MTTQHWFAGRTDYEHIDALLQAFKINFTDFSGQLLTDKALMKVMKKHRLQRAWKDLEDKVSQMDPEQINAALKFLQDQPSISKRQVGDCKVVNTHVRPHSPKKRKPRKKR